MSSSAVKGSTVTELRSRRDALLAMRNAQVPYLSLYQLRHHEAIEAGNARNTAWYGNEVKKLCDRLAEVVYDLHKVELDLLYAEG